MGDSAPNHPRRRANGAQADHVRLAIESGRASTGVPPVRGLPTPAGRASSSAAAERLRTMGAGVSTARLSHGGAGAVVGRRVGTRGRPTVGRTTLLSGRRLAAVLQGGQEWRELPTTALAPALLGRTCPCAPCAAEGVPSGVYRRPIWGTWTQNLSARSPARSPIRFGSRRGGSGS